MPPPLGFNLTEGLIMCPVSSLTIGGGAFRHVILGWSWDQTLMSLASFPEITCSMEDCYTLSLNMISVTIQQIVARCYESTPISFFTLLC